MGRWVSIDNIIEEFTLTASPTEPAAVLRELRQRLAEAHPDRTGGKFETTDNQDAYLRLSAAIEFLESQQPQTALVPADQLALAVTSLAEIVARMNSPSDVPVPTRRELRAEMRESRRQQAVVPKVTSGVAFGVATGLFAFMGQLRDHPIFSVLIERGDNRMLLAVGWFVSGMIFVQLWLRERFVDATTDYYLSDDGIEELAFNLREELFRRQSRKFSRRDVAETIRDSHGRALGIVTRTFGRLDRQSAAKVATAVIDVLLDRKAIMKIPDPDIVDYYEIHERLIRSIARLSH